MTRAALVFASMVVLMVAASPASAKVSKLKVTTIVEGQSLGGVKIGAGKASAIKAWGKPDSPCKSYSCQWGASKGGGLMIMLRAGKIVDITAGIFPTTGPKVRARLTPLRTSSGVKLGDALDKVEQLYPTARRWAYDTGSGESGPQLELGPIDRRYTHFKFHPTSRRLLSISVSIYSGIDPDSTTNATP